MDEQPLLKIGSRIKPNRDSSELYILAQIDSSRLNLISLHDGNRYSKAIDTQQGSGITKEEWKKWSESCVCSNFEDAVFQESNRFCTQDNEWKLVKKFFNSTPFKKVFQFTRGSGYEIEAYHKNKEVRVGCLAVSLATLKLIVDYLDSPVEP